MNGLDQLAIVGAGMVAGAINAVVGSGTLITFPVLLALGVPPVTANVSNALGLVPGSLSGVIGYRRELEGQGRRLRWLAPATVIGGLVGALLLLIGPAGAFEKIVPILIVVALVMVVAQPTMALWVSGRRGESEPAGHGGPILWLAILSTGVYGGYFGAAQGVLLLALLGVFLPDDLQRLNAVKNVLALLANLVAGLIFLVRAPVDLSIVILIAFGSVIGGHIGARIGRRLPAPVLRGVIVVVGMIAVVHLLWSH